MLQAFHPSLSTLFSVEKKKEDSPGLQFACGRHRGSHSQLEGCVFDFWRLLCGVYVSTRTEPQALTCQ